MSAGAHNHRVANDWMHQNTYMLEPTDKNSKLSPSEPESSPESWLLLSTVSEDAAEVLACVPCNHLDSYDVDT